MIGVPLFLSSSLAAFKRQHRRASRTGERIGTTRLVSRVVRAGREINALECGPFMRTESIPTVPTASAQMLLNKSHASVPSYTLIPLSSFHCMSPCVAWREECSAAGIWNQASTHALMVLSLSDAIASKHEPSIRPIML